MPENHITQAKWSSPVTNRLLLEAGTYYFYQHHMYKASPASAYQVGVVEPTNPAAWPAQELSTGKWIGGSRVAVSNDLLARWWGTSGALSYVTGSHNLKVGFTHVKGFLFTISPPALPVLQFLNGVPFQVLLSPRPGEARPRANHEVGLYAQDQWTRQRLTLNLGARFDYINEQVDAQYAPAGRWYRYWGTATQEANAFYMKDPLAYVYNPDVTRAGITSQPVRSETLKLTWQVSQQHWSNRPG
jgi:hypothetical protein